MGFSSGLARIDRAVRNAVPLATILGAVLLANTTLPMQRTIATGLPLIAVYGWVLLRPDLTPAGGLFLIGLLHDALAGLPPGLHALVFILVRPAVAGRGRVLLRRGPVSLWWGFTLLAPAVALGSWLVLSILRGVLHPAGPPIAATTAAIIMFPAMLWCQFRLLPLLPPPDRGHAPAR